MALSIIFEGAEMRGWKPTFIDFTPQGNPTVIRHDNKVLLTSENLDPTTDILQRLEEIHPFEPPNGENTVNK